MTQVTVSLHESESDTVNLVKLCVILERFLDTILRADKIIMIVQANKVFNCKIYFIFVTFSKI